MKKILISLTTALGDNVCATVALGAVRKAYPTAEITVMAWEHHRFVFERCPYVDKVIIVDFWKNEYRKMWRFAQMLRRSSYDFAICLDNKSQMLMAMRLAGIKPIYLIGGMYGRINIIKRYLLSDKVIMVDSRNQTVNVIEQYLDAVEAITGVRGERYTNLGKIDSGELDAAMNLLRDNGYDGKKKLVALCIRDEKKLIKHWTAAGWIDTLQKLVNERDCFCFTVGIKSEAEYAQKVIESAGAPAVNLCGKTDIKKVMALLKCADVFLAPCSGLGHIAAALQVPTIVVYTNSRIYTWALPHDEFMPVFSFVDCLCYTDSNNCANRRCCTEISGADVLTAFDNMIEQLKSTGRGSTRI